MYLLPPITYSEPEYMYKSVGQYLTDFSLNLHLGHNDKLLSGGVMITKVMSHSKKKKTNYSSYTIGNYTASTIIPSIYLFLLSPVARHKYLNLTP